MNIIDFLRVQSLLFCTLFFYKTFITLQLQPTFNLVTSLSFHWIYWVYNFERSFF